VKTIDVPTHAPVQAAPPAAGSFILKIDPGEISISDGKGAGVVVEFSDVEAGGPELALAWAQSLQLFDLSQSLKLLASTFAAAEKRAEAMQLNTPAKIQETLSMAIGILPQISQLFGPEGQKFMDLLASAGANGAGHATPAEALSRPAKSDGKET